MDFGKSLASYLIFDLALPLVGAAIQQGVPHGDAFATVLAAGGDVGKTLLNHTAGTSIGDAVSHTLQNHLPNLIQAGASVISKELPHGDLVMQAVEAFGKTLQH